MSKVVKIIDLKNNIEAGIFSQKLKEQNIPHNVKSLHDSALDGLYQTQHGWGYIEADEIYKEDILKLYEEMNNADFIENENDVSDINDTSYKNEYKMIHNKKWRNILTIFILILAVFVFIFIIREYVKLKNEIKFLKSENNNVFNYIWNEEENLKYSNWKNKDIPASKSFDGNKNMYYEKIFFFNQTGKILAEYNDKNENGFFEYNIMYDSSENRISEQFDLDDDGKIDKTINYYKNGVKIEWLDKDKSGFLDYCEVTYKDGTVKIFDLKKDVFKIEK